MAPCGHVCDQCNSQSSFVTRLHTSFTTVRAAQPSVIEIPSYIAWRKAVL